MNNSPISSHILILLIIISILTGCLPISTAKLESTPKSSQEVASPNSIDTPTPQSPVSEIETPEIHNLLNQNTDYIIYVKENPNDHKNEIWAINPNENAPILVLTGSELWPWSLSPSGKFWLITSKYSLYLANSDGSNVHSVFYDNQYIQIHPFWLNDTKILFNAYTDLTLPPMIYELDIKTQIVKQIYEDKEVYIQSVFPSIESWLQVDWNSGGIQTQNLSGSIESFLKGYEVSLNPFSASKFQFLTNSNEIVFLGNKDQISRYQIWKINLKTGTTKLLFDPETDGWVDKFLVSPDEKHIAFTYPKPGITFLNIANTESQKLKYQWVYPYRLNSSNFVWSPNAKEIAVPYASDELGSTLMVDSGIQIIDITSGETRILLNENVVKIIGWYLIK